MHGSRCPLSVRDRSNNKLHSRGRIASGVDSPVACSSHCGIYDDLACGIQFDS
jgi:hypothetical protein